MPPNVPKAITDLRVKIFADGADKAHILEMYRQPYVKGFTTNPTLMHKAGVRNYQAFALDVLQAIPDRPISFEVFADDFREMERQALTIQSWGPNVYVKIPVTNTRGESSREVVRRLCGQGVKVNVTALTFVEQVREVVTWLAGAPPCYISVFAGRIADTGRNPVPIMAAALEIMRAVPAAELIWASPREILNLYQADEIGCHVITVTSDILKKIPLLGKSLEEFSLDTVRMFYEDGRRVGFSL